MATTAEDRTIGCIIELLLSFSYGMICIRPSGLIHDLYALNPNIELILGTLVAMQGAAPED